MRILVLSNFFPPHGIGGMEYRCKETIDSLHKRGHEVLTLTSNYGVAHSVGTQEKDVIRALNLESDLLHYRPLGFFISRRRLERQNRNHLWRLLNRFDPDVVFVWGLWNLSRALPAFAERHRPGRVIYSLANDWPAKPDMHTTYWQTPARRRPLKPIKWVLGSIALTILAREQAKTNLNYDYAICASHSLRNQLLGADVPLKNTTVIYPGIDLEPFVGLKRSTMSVQRRKSLSLLYAGTLAPHKGVHTAIESISYLARDEPGRDISLTIAGSGHPSYEEQLRQLVTEKDLDNSVRFLGRVPRHEMPYLLSQFDALLFPSIWEEPFARIVLESMAAGLAVIGTRRGGTKEILVDRVTGLTFEPNDAASLANQIKQIASNPRLHSRVVQNAKRKVVQDFGIERMVEEIEAYLLDIVHGSLDKQASPISESVRVESHLRSRPA